MWDDPEVTWWIKAIAYIAFAAIGGFMGHIMRTIDSEQKIGWGRATLEAGSAGFVGFMVLLVCQAMGVGQEWTGVIVGVSGWLGASATIRMLEVLVRNRLGIGSNANTPPRAPSEEP